MYVSLVGILSSFSVILAPLYLGLKELLAIILIEKAFVFEALETLENLRIIQILKKMEYCGNFRQIFAALFCSHLCHCSYVVVWPSDFALAAVAGLTSAAKRLLFGYSGRQY